MLTYFDVSIASMPTGIYQTEIQGNTLQRINQFAVVFENVFAELLFVSHDDILVQIATINDLPISGIELYHQRNLLNVQTTNFSLGTYVYVIDTTLQQNVYNLLRQDDNRFGDRLSSQISTLSFLNGSTITSTVDKSSVRTESVASNSNQSSIVIWYQVLLYIIVGFILFISILGFLHGKNKCNSLNRLSCISRVDDVNYSAFVVYSLQVWDLASDVIFAIQTVPAYTSRPNASTIHLIIVFASFAFVLIPYFTNIAASLKIYEKIKHLNLPYSWQWFARNSTVYGLFVLLSGGAYAGLALVNSKLFGMKIFTCGLTQQDLAEFTSMRVKHNVILENVPQFIVQLMFIIFFDDENGLTSLSGITILAMISTFSSIAIASMAFAFSKQYRLDRM